MDKHEWKDRAECLGMETNDFFDNYEENLETRKDIDSICASCPVATQCFAVAVSTKGWGVAGGVYFENGKISREFNKHRNKQDWAKVWEYLTIDKE